MALLHVEGVLAEHLARRELHEALERVERRRGRLEDVVGADHVDAHRPDGALQHGVDPGDPCGVDDVRAALDERGVRPARLQRAGGPCDEHRLVGEAQSRACAVSKLAGEHMAHAYHAELGVPPRTRAAVAATSTAPGRSAAGRSARSSRRRSRAATSRSAGDGFARRIRASVLRRRHGRALHARARRPGRPSARASRTSGTRRWPSRSTTPTPRWSQAHRLPGRDSLRAAGVHRRRAADPQHREGAHAPRLRGARRARRGARADDRVVPRRLGAPA